MNTAAGPDASSGSDGVAVVVVAGGRSSRFGSDKVALLLDGLLDGLPAAWPVVCVGPARATRRAVTWTREEPPFAGPLAGVGAGMAVLPPSAELVLVLAADMPHAGRAVSALTQAMSATAGRGRVPADVACLVDSDGYRQPLLACYDCRWLRRRLEVLGALANRPARLLLEQARLAEVRDGWDAGRDVDEPGDLPVTG